MTRDTGIRPVVRSIERAGRRALDERLKADGVPRRERRHAANPIYAEAMRQLRRSSAASPHTPAPRKGTRGARSRAAIKEGRES